MKRILTTLFAVVFGLALLALPASAADAITVGDFTIAPTDGTTVLAAGTDYTYASGKLTITTTTPVTVGMSTGVTTTDDTIVADSSNGEAYVTFNSIIIDTEEKAAITVQGVNKVTFAFAGESTLSVTSTGYGIDVASKTPFVMTSTNNGKLSISDTKFAVYANGYTAGGSIAINGNLKLDISNCAYHAIYCGNSSKYGVSLTISGTPVINIDTTEYAMYAYGIDISGGEISIKNDDGYPICGGSDTDITLSGSADLHIVEGRGGLRSGEGKITITGSAKYKVYDTDAQGNKVAVVDKFPLISTKAVGEVEISGNAVLELYSANDAISCGKTSVLNHAQVSIVISTDLTSSEYAISFDDTLTIANYAVVDIDVTKGTKIRGLNDYDGTVNVSDNAVVTINGTTYDGVYVKALNLSGNASVTVNAAEDNAIYGDISVADTATLTATSVDTRVIYNPCTVTPAEGKVYVVKYGKSKTDVTTSYYTTTTKIDDKSAWRYFYAEAIEPYSVTITFDTDGGSEIAAITQNLGTAVTAPADPTKLGYTFAGWDKTIPATMPAEDMMVKAKWTPNSYTITFDPANGSDKITITQDYGTLITAPTVTWEGHTFASWDKTVPETIPAEDMEITAIWDVNTYALSWVVDGVTQTTNVAYGASITAPADPTKQNYTFAGWDAVIPATMPARDLTFTALWTAIPESIIAPTTGGEVTVSTRIPTQGESVTITPVPEQGMAIDSVTVTDANGAPVGVIDNGDGTYTYIQPEGVVTITVTFTAIPQTSATMPDYWMAVLLKKYNTAYPITAAAGEGGSITPAGVTGVLYKRSFTYTITPDEGYAIADVLVDGVSVGAVSSYTFKQVRAAHVIEVFFTPVDAPVDTPVDTPDGN